MMNKRLTGNFGMLRKFDTERENVSFSLPFQTIRDLRPSAKEIEADLGKLYR